VTRDQVLFTGDGRVRFTFVGTQKDVKDILGNVEKRGLTISSKENFCMRSSEIIDYDNCNNCSEDAISMSGRMLDYAHNYP